MAAFLDTYSERDFHLLMTFLNEVGEILARSQSLLLKKDQLPRRRTRRGLRPSGNEQDSRHLGGSGGSSVSSSSQLRYQAELR